MYPYPAQLKKNEMKGKNIKKKKEKEKHSLTVTLSPDQYTKGKTFNSKGKKIVKIHINSN
jgi:hypothetical protein